MNFNHLEEAFRIMKEHVPDLPEFGSESSSESDDNWSDDNTVTMYEEPNYTSSEESDISSCESQSMVLNIELPKKFNIDKMPYGCKHYLCRCSIIAPCCQTVYGCRVCHNEAETHVIERSDIHRIVCSSCNKEQDVSDECINCGICFGLYTCIKCRLFSDICVDQYHCDKCGICRIGPKEKIFHCDNCGICYDSNFKNTHICRLNMKDDTCPVCLEKLFDSLNDLYVPPCNHAIHHNCFIELVKTTYKCPCCSVAMFNIDHINQQMDEEVENTPMPHEYNHIFVDILCNECHSKSKVQYHIVGMKCIDCFSYNTRQI
jgi:RING finger and CHY zinc finger domain-containing protein 1